MEKAASSIAYLLKNGCTPYVYRRCAGRKDSSASETQHAKNGDEKTNGKNSNNGNPAWCSIHQCEMKRWDKDGRVWYSHKEVISKKDISLTDEQVAVIQHPLGVLALVLAVPGSGKTLSMACRIQHLVQECYVPPHAIRVLMFNRLARQQFRAQLDRTGLPDTLQPEVHTFHSFAFHVINEMVRIGVLSVLTQFWTGEKEELIWLTLRIKALR